MGACAIGSLFFLQRLLVQSDHIPKTVSFALLIAFILTADKFVSTLKNAQTDLLLIALFSIALYHYRKSVIITALCLAFAASIKYHALLFLVLFLFRRQWKAAGLTFLFFWILLLLPALTVGWNTNLTYIQDAFSGVLNMFMNIESNRTGEVTDIAAAIEPISWVRSISLTSAMARLNDMLPETLSLVTPLIFLGVLGGACFATIKSYKSNGINALGAQTKLQEGQRVSPVDICDWSIVLILLVILAPQSTARHFIFMFIPLCALSYGALRTTEKGLRYLTWSLLIAFAVTLNMPLSEYPNLMDAWRSFSIPSWIMLALLILLPRLYLSPSLSGKREDDTAEQEKPYE